jgi:hypothetical protein
VAWAAGSRGKRWSLARCWPIGKEASGHRLGHAAQVGLDPLAICPQTIQLGTHWLSDVLAGWTAGGLVLLATASLTTLADRLSRTPAVLSTGPQRVRPHHAARGRDLTRTRPDAGPSAAVAFTDSAFRVDLAGMAVQAGPWRPVGVFRR